MNSDTLLEKKEKYASLLSIYSALLTDSIRRRMELFYLEDYSLSEIADEENVSRNAIHESILLGIKQLDKYERALNLLDKEKTLLEQLNKIQKIDDEEKRNDFIEKMKGEY